MMASLSKEISCVLILKVLFILGLWWLCFSHPIQEHLTSADLGQHILNSNVLGEKHDS